MELRFKKPQPLGLRLWHWLNALAILGLLGTVLLRKTFLSWRTNAALIQTKVAEAGFTGLSADQAAGIARDLRAPMWQWHYLLGFVLVGLFLFRLAVGLSNAERTPVRSTLRDLARYFALPAAQKRASLHYLLVSTGHAVFYGAVLFICASGLGLYFKEPLGLSKGLAGGIKESHELVMWFFALFAAGHLLGVVVAELQGERGIVSDMIHGGQTGAGPPQRG